MSRKVAVIGQGELYEKVTRFLTDRGIEVPDTVALDLSGVAALIDLEAGTDERHRDWLTVLEENLPEHVPVFTSVLHRTATEIASWLKRPERVVGFSPLFLSEMTLLEVSRPLQAEESASWERHLEFWNELGKEVEMVGDEPGLVFPRTLALLVNEASFALMENVASREDIDLAMRKGTNWPHGPLAWADLAGIDRIVDILSGLHRETGDDRYRPAPLLRKMVYAGWTGKAAGRGFYRYEA
ncbi:3-hydroxyacyl-CoA dehydrogenase family protein [Staphylospora marina]|uniref:3-hydroxyacyl-CoA dehydrogenase family protein n=1 Tax=Staphylospora marina TaxID=2490858 RepID=UPI000F5BC429|nr:3-hydroxyacyl-CoA dehydrogenase family protein [Staphylospora marina]